MQIRRGAFYEPRRIAAAVEKKVNACRDRGEPINYLALVPDGEPTLDVNLGQELELLRPLDIEIAVITNGSLLWREDVRQDLQGANWVSLKVDAVTHKIWHSINRPYRYLKLDSVLEGMVRFASAFKGEITTETMLVQNYNDDREEIERIAKFLKELKPSKSYLTNPIRPPAEDNVNTCSEEALNMAYQIFEERLTNVEYLAGYEGDAFAFTGDVKKDLLDITAVHPMRESAVTEFLNRAGASWKTVQGLMDDGNLVQLEYKEERFYARRLPKLANRGLRM
jgi:wyosine [tRNA(Phe)-imidazoG37] synthetase (radical SAM superfamily)